MGRNKEKVLVAPAKNHPARPNPQKRIPSVALAAKAPAGPPKEKRGNSAPPSTKSGLEKKAPPFRGSPKKIPPKAFRQ